MKAKSWSSAVRAVRARGVFSWVSVIWFTTFSSDVSRAQDLHVTPSSMARCGDDVKLTCTATSSRQLTVMSFVWLSDSGPMCELKQKSNDPRILCENEPDDKLTVTLVDVTPADQGSYLCKLVSTHGSNSSRTSITVTDCMGGYNVSTTDSEAECTFSGVYPNGTVHWSHGDVNLTDSATTRQEGGEHGLLDIWSRIAAPKGNRSEPVRCSLWIPSARKYLHSQEVYFKGKQEAESSGNRATLQWIFMLVQVLMVTFMT